MKAQVSPREFRYGNIFMAGKVPAIGFEFMAAGITYDRLDAEDVGCHCEWKDVQPIELNEEWLVKLGFTKQDLDLSIAYHKTFGENERLQLWLSGECRLWLNWGCAWKEDYRSLPCKIKYVSQLQNVFYFLTGQELTINQLK